jgi:type IV secretory pathway VirD2 relaxase
VKLPKTKARKQPGERDDGHDIDLGGREASLKLGGKESAKRLTFKGFRQIMKAVQDGKKVAGAGRRAGRSKGPSARWLPPRPSRALAMNQRVSVRLTYTRNKMDGQWKAHGRYLEREGATGKGEVGRGFDGTDDAVAISPLLDRWQAEGDPNLFKFIVSPENGERLDMQEYTREYMASLERQLGTKLEWVAAVHYNTDHPHAHVALRGLDDRGQAVVLSREFITGPLRTTAQDIATRSLGHRTQDDIRVAREKQIEQQRFTDLDRALLRAGTALPDGRVRIDYSKAVQGTASELRKEQRLALVRRLAVLEKLGLAAREPNADRVWNIDPAMQAILRDRQKADDRLKTLHEHRAMASDPRLPLAAMPEGPIEIAGRLIGTGMDDASGKAYMLLESTAGSVIYLYQSSAAERARSEGLRAGDFVVINQRTYERDGKTLTAQEVRTHGPAEGVVTNRTLLGAEVKRHLQRTGQLPKDSTWGGWLGTFQNGVRDHAKVLQGKGLIREQAGTGRYELVESRRNGPGRGK